MIFAKVWIGLIKSNRLENKTIVAQESNEPGSRAPCGSLEKDLSNLVPNNAFRNDVLVLLKTSIYFTFTCVPSPISEYSYQANHNCDNIWYGRLHPCDIREK